MTRQLGQAAGRLGVELAAPYYDDRVVEAGLAVRAADRVTPWAYKPLIVAAMRGIVPAGSLTRQTKANGSADVEPGLRRHRAELLALWEDSRLGALGLVDAAAVRAACRGPLPPELQFGVLDQLVACEVWLRSLEPLTTARAEERPMALTLRPGVSTADTDYGTTLLDERSGEYFTLNPTGALVLRTLLGGGTADGGGPGAHRAVRRGPGDRRTRTSPSWSAVCARPGWWRSR